jgi:hypothetical protein
VVGVGAWCGFFVKIEEWTIDNCMEFMLADGTWQLYKIDPVSIAGFIVVLYNTFVSQQANRRAKNAINETLRIEDFWRRFWNFGNDDNRE